jgi:hypothetical protein
MKEIVAFLPVLALAACTRDQRDVIPLPEAGTTWVELAPMNLRTPDDFDRLDQVLMRKGTPADVIKAYDDLAAVAPDDRAVRFRGAFAALVLDPVGRGPRVAADAIRRLGPGPEADYLSIRVDRRAFLDEDGRVAVPPGKRDAAAALAARIAAFVAANPGWKGPMGRTVEDVREMGRELESGGNTGNHASGSNREL